MDLIQSITCTRISGTIRDSEGNSVTGALPQPGTYTAATESVVSVSEGGNVGIVIIFRQNAEFFVGIHNSADEAKRCVDLQLGEAAYLSIAGVTRFTGQGVFEGVPVESFAGRRRLRVRTRALGAIGTMFSVRTDATGKIGVLCLDGEVDVPNGDPNDPDEGPFARIKANEYIVLRVVGPPIPTPAKSPVPY